MIKIDKSILSPHLIVFLLLFQHIALAQRIDNVRASQEGKIIVVTYDLTGLSSCQSATVKLYCSEDGGATWGSVLQKVTGDAGSGIKAGTGKRIVWDVLSERERFVGDRMMFEVRLSIDNIIANEVNLIEEEEDKPVFTIVEEMPTFPGGEEAGVKFLTDNIHYPEQASENGIQGIVYVSFIIDSKGNVTDVKVLRGIGGGCDEEAIRVIKIMPKWNPGKQNGKPVRVLYNMPIIFTLSK